MNREELIPIEPVWMNTYHCVFDRSFERYVDELPAPEELVEALQQRRMIFCWLYTPGYESVMLSPGESCQLELVGASYKEDNGSPIQHARFYRSTRSGGKDFIKVSYEGKLSDGLTFEELVEGEV